MRFAAAIFDLDGTLIDSLADIGTSMNRALAAHDLPTHPIERYREFVGEGVEVLARKATGDHPTLQAAVLATYRGLYADNLFGHTMPYAGISELLAELRTLLRRQHPRRPPAAGRTSPRGICRWTSPARM